MLVICFEGPHGSGKSQLYSCCKSAGYDVLDEAFIGMPSFSLHPQTLVMETIWVSEWVKRLLQRQKELGAAAQRTVFFCDRSPYSAVFYSQRGGELLSPLITAQLRELYEQAGIRIFTVYLKTEPELLWRRIQKRLADEPFRAMYNEGSRGWMDDTVAWYEKMAWDYVLHNNDVTIPEVLQTLLGLLEENVENFRQYIDLPPLPGDDAAAASAAPVDEDMPVTLARKRTVAELPTSPAKCSADLPPMKKLTTIAQKSSV